MPVSAIDCRTEFLQDGPNHDRRHLDPAGTGVRHTQELHLRKGAAYSRSNAKVRQDT